MNRKEFLKRLLKTGEVSKNELITYCLKYYFAEGYTISDLEEDLVINYNTSEIYARALVRDIKEAIKKL